VGHSPNAERSVGGGKEVTRGKRKVNRKTNGLTSCRDEKTWLTSRERGGLGNVRGEDEMKRNGLGDQRRRNPNWIPGTRKSFPRTEKTGRLWRSGLGKILATRRTRSGVEDLERSSI